MFKYAAIALLLLGCSNKHNSPILVERGVEPFEREYHVKQEGYGITPAQKKIFMQGYVTEGMTQDMVRYLWGVPDRILDEGATWEFVTQKGNVITTVKFGDHKILLNERVLFVTDIAGDRYGGSPAPGSKK